jgi:malate dehydrogenase
MSVVTANDVEKADGVLLLAAGDVITPLARDRAKELGVRLERGPSIAAPSSAGAPERMQPLPRATATTAPPASPPRSGALYRRGAYGLDGRRSATSRPVLAIVGAGHVGAASATRLADTDLFEELRLIDVVDGLAAGLALDIWHGASLRGFTTNVSGGTDLGRVAGADIVVVTAGRARTPGMSRTDLTVANAEIVRGIGHAIRTSAPDATVVVVTNPLEEMTELMCRVTGFPPERVIGMGGILDTARFRSLVAASGSARPQDIDAIVLGSHGAEMVVPLSRAFANGVPLEDVLSADALAEIVKRTRESGAEVTALLKVGSAYVSPGSSIARHVEAMVRGSDEILPACVRSRGAFGTTDTRVGLPVRLGPRGLREIVPIPLRDDEVRALRASADAIDARIRRLA